MMPKNKFDTEEWFKDALDDFESKNFTPTVWEKLIAERFYLMGIDKAVEIIDRKLEAKK